MATYNKTTAYSDTSVNDFYLDVMENRPISKIEDDVLFEINETYKFRPDLLAYDLYDNAELWWVFAQRNPDVLVNPLLDFDVGVKIFLPKLTTLREELGF